MTTDQQTEVKEVVLSPKELDSIEAKGFDPEEYTKVSTTIETIKFRESTNDKYGNKNNMFMILQTAEVGKYEDEPVYASETFSVYTDEENNITGYPKAGKLMTFLKENKKEKISELIGLKVMTKAKLSGATKDRLRLGFNVV